jgi:hypothetical protein
VFSPLKVNRSIRDCRMAKARYERNGPSQLVVAKPRYMCKGTYETQHFMKGVRAVNSTVASGVRIKPGIRSLWSRLGNGIGV